ncbi:MAG: hypothetical protein MN733_27135 [Nitrososphaera sp.]|nr:hypothetical protein [Nitrososphaera sp.]
MSMHIESETEEHQCAPPDTTLVRRLLVDGFMASVKIAAHYKKETRS